MASRLCQILLLAYLTSALADESLPAEAEDESCLSLKQLRARKMEEVSSVETDASEAFNRSADEPTASTDELLDGVFTAAQGDYSDVMDSSGELGSGWHHHHHAGGNIMTLYTKQVQGFVVPSYEVASDLVASAGAAGVSTLLVAQVAHMARQSAWIHIMVASFRCRSTWAESNTWATLASHLHDAGDDQLDGLSTA
eukprot:CAMPEP_0197649702 /NCGR_PEP_ID=MMETSP1338-20131121/29353_1 /TAXON_ID=43686 ORGANISM="Pelagodinium beii, Strain RCC1491" /NCGR_SAMPLE_ID=MMETSP1338 /ASSEMBLY_ACC=CAM_ASM_000754 /LENGTH=196 /DNA_ID=CAMNT_0043223945 /DNA_START=42 /DNA_END=633 /DNA_ORIENTATION=+